jgi:Putative Ig domain
MALQAIGNTGLSIETTTGLISGTPIVSGNLSFNITATGSAGSVTKNFNINVIGALTGGPQVISSPTISVWG